MAQAKNGDTVKVHYTGKLEDGTVFDTSIDRDPLRFTIGEERIMPAFEQAVVGMNPGDSKSSKVLADQAYGRYREELAAVIERNEIPTDLELEVGQRLKMRHPAGQTIVVTVTDVSESNVTLDANHPLAGKDLIFDIQLLEIV